MERVCALLQLAFRMIFKVDSPPHLPRTWRGFLPLPRFQEFPCFLSLVSTKICHIVQPIPKVLDYLSTIQKEEKNFIDNQSNLLIFLMRKLKSRGLRKFFSPKVAQLSNESWNQFQISKAPHPRGCPFHQPKSTTD